MARVASISSAYSRIAAASVPSIVSNPSARSTMPGLRLPATAYNEQSGASARAIACSRPPPPTNSTVSLIPEKDRGPRVSVTLFAHCTQSAFAHCHQPAASCRPLLLEGVVENDRLIAAGADADRIDRRRHIVADVVEILAGIGWDRLIPLLGDGGPVNLIPRFERFEHGFTLAPPLGRRRHRQQLLAITLVGMADVDLIESGQHIDMIDGEAGEAVGAGCMPQHRHIEPADPSRPPGDRSKLAAFLADEVREFLLAVSPIKFGRQWACANPREIGLHDADDLALADDRRGDAGADGRAAGSRI